MSEAISDRIVPDEPLDPSSRRLFLGVAGLAGAAYAAALAYPVYRYLASPVEMSAAAAAVSEVMLKDAHKLAAGSVLMFKFGSAPTMLIHHADDTWVAFGAVCTHLGCTVQYQARQDRIFCACHGGIYNAHTGKNVAGPPPKPLKPFAVKLTGEGVLVTRA